MSYFQAVPTIFVLHLRNLFNPGIFVSAAIATVPLAAVVAWIATQSVGSEPMAYISIGVVLMLMWQFAFSLSGWSLASEFDLGTVDHTLVSRTPLSIVMLVKAVANLSIAIPGSVIAFASVQLISRQMMDVERPIHLVISMVVAAWSIIVMGYLFAPLFVLVKGRPGFFNALMPLRTALIPHFPDQPHR